MRHPSGVSVTSSFYGVSVTRRSLVTCLLLFPFLVVFSPTAETASFAKISVKTPGELLLAKVQNADVTITVMSATPRLEVSARSEGKGLSLPSKRKWNFKHLKAGSKTHLKVPYQLAKGFKKGSVQFEIFMDETKAGPNRLPAQKQTATLTLSR